MQRWAPRFRRDTRYTTTVVPAARLPVNPPAPSELARAVGAPRMTGDAPGGPMSTKEGAMHRPTRRRIGMLAGAICICLLAALPPAARAQAGYPGPTSAPVTPLPTPEGGYGSPYPDAEPTPEPPPAEDPTPEAPPEEDPTPEEAVEEPPPEEPPEEVAPTETATPEPTPTASPTPPPSPTATTAATPSPTATEAPAPSPTPRQPRRRRLDRPDGSPIAPTLFVALSPGRLTVGLGIHLVRRGPGSPSSMY